MKPLSRAALCLILAASAGVAWRHRATPPVVANARAQAPEPQADTAAVVTRAFLEPLAKRESERPKFSRSPMPPDERKARVTAGPMTDASGRAFQAFAVDARRGDNWTKDILTGCVYPSNGAVYVRSGEDFYPAGAYFGQKWDKAADSICRSVVRPPS
jgi:hypothetical protein